MIVDVAQRWESGRARYRPAGEPIDTRAYDVAILKRHAEARTFVERHHYGPLGSSGCQALRDLGDAVREMGGQAEFLALIEREWGLLVAMTRKAAEERRAAREVMDPETGEITTASCASSCRACASSAAAATTA